MNFYTKSYVWNSTRYIFILFYLIENCFIFVCFVLQLIKFIWQKLNYRINRVVWNFEDCMQTFWPIASMVLDFSQLPTSPRKWLYLHERCLLCLTEWKINFLIFAIFIFLRYGKSCTEFQKKNYVRGLRFTIYQKLTKIWKK